VFLGLIASCFDILIAILTSILNICSTVHVFCFLMGYKRVYSVIQVVGPSFSFQREDIITRHIIMEIRLWFVRKNPDKASDHPRNNTVPMAW
jgi:hypothetical protein